MYTNPKPIYVNGNSNGHKTPTDKLLPHNLEAEEAVLGAILIGGQDAMLMIAPIALAPADFFIERHGFIFAAIQALYQGHKPLDYVTIVTQLEQQGHLVEIGGASEITRLMASTPTYFHAAHYAELVKDCSIRRQVVNSAGAVARLAHDDLVPAADLLEQSRGLLLKISAANITNEPVPLSALRGEFLDYLEAMENCKNGIPGIPTGFYDLDRKIGGLQRGDLILVGGRPRMGKCLGRGTKVLMYNGTLKAVEEVMEGDLLMGDDSCPRRVLSITQGYGSIYLIQQNKGVSYRVNEQHVLSLKRSRDGVKDVKKGDVLDISIPAYLRRSNKFKTNYKGYKVAVEFSEKELCVEPYFMGLWLGDGHSYDVRICNTDPEVIDYLYEYAHRLGLQVTKYQDDYGITNGKRGHNRAFSLEAELVSLGVLENKHIPQCYLSNSRQNRLQLLAGLVDSDGHYQDKGHVFEIVQKNEALAKQIKFLADTLGFRTSLIKKMASIKSIGFSGPVYRVRISGDLEQVPTKIPRKQARLRTGRVDWRHTGINVYYDGDDEYYGFALDGNHRFLLEDMTVTHNSALVGQVAYNAAQQGKRALVFSLEMSAQQINQRLVSIESGIPLKALRTNQIPDSKYPILYHAMNLLARLPVFIDDKSRYIDEIIAKAITHHARQGVDLVIVDYAQRIRTRQRYQNRDAEIGDISGPLKSLAMQDLNVPVVLISSLSRACEARGDKRPMLSDLRESGNLEYDADVVMFLYRDEVYNSDTQYPNMAELAISKNRNGEEGMIELFFKKEVVSFVSLEKRVIPLKQVD